jgi:prepilin-type N-terminal cleavage/methylation domain-containing protein
MASGAVNRRGQRGFTLLELLITLSVTTIGLVGLLSLHLSVARGNDGASRSAEAQQICASQLEALRALSYSEMMQLLAGSPSASPPASAGPALLPGRAGMTFSVTSSVAAVPGSPSLVKVRVVTQWAEDGATLGSSAGQLDHAVALEILRTVEEAL